MKFPCFVELEMTAQNETVLVYLQPSKNRSQRREKIRKRLSFIWRTLMIENILLLFGTKINIETHKQQSYSHSVQKNLRRAALLSVVSEKDNYGKNQGYGTT